MSEKKKRKCTVFVFVFGLKSIRENENDRLLPVPLSLLYVI